MGPPLRGQGEEAGLQPGCPISTAPQLQHLGKPELSFIPFWALYSPLGSLLLRKMNSKCLAGAKP